MTKSKSKFFSPKSKLFYILIVISTLLIIPLIFFLIKLNNISNETSNYNNLTKSTSSQNIKKITSTSPWPINPTPEISLKELMSPGCPSPSNLDRIKDWAKNNFNVAFGDQLTSQAFVEASKQNPVFDWSLVGKATTAQFKAFITFYGKDSGLINFKTINFVGTDINFSDPQFWASLKAYMPNLEEINIAANSLVESTMNKLPAEIGLNTFKKITITNEDIGENYENFLYENAPLCSTIERLKINSCNLKDHDEIDPTIENDKIFYFTDLMFTNAPALKKLKILDLSLNQLTHVKGNLINLPSIIDLRLADNQIKKWHCVDARGSEGTWTDKDHFEPVSGLNQFCFPNPNGIYYVDISGNKLFELVHLSPSEWASGTVEQYRKHQKSTYKTLQFVNISRQEVEFNAFVFGNNIASGSDDTVGDMEVDLSNIYVMPDTYTTPSEQTEYINQCLQDRIENIYYVSDADKWSKLQLTQNIMPSIVDLFGKFSNYHNYSPFYQISGGDFKVDQQFKVIGARNGQTIQAKYYMQQEISEEYPEPTDGCYFTNECSSNIKANDSILGAKALKLCPGKECADFDYMEDTYVTGVSTTINTPVHNVEITPEFYIDLPDPDFPDWCSSKYFYNISVYNSEDYIFYLRGINETDSSGKPIYNSYVKSISDENITIDDVYNHFFDLITYSGNPNKWENFKYNMDDRNYFSILSVANDKKNRKLRINVQYFAYQYAEEKTELPEKVVLLITINTYPYYDDTLEWILTYIWGGELILLTCLLAAWIYFLIRTRIKTKQIATIKQQKIEDANVNKNKDAPTIDIQEHKYKDKKIPMKQRIINQINNGDNSKTQKVIDKPKPTKDTQTAIDVDSILDKIE